MGWVQALRSPANLLVASQQIARMSSLYHGTSEKPRQIERTLWPAIRSSNGRLPGLELGACRLCEAGLGIACTGKFGDLVAEVLTWLVVG